MVSPLLESQREPIAVPKQGRAQAQAQGRKPSKPVPLEGGERYVVDLDNGHSLIVGAKAAWRAANNGLRVQLYRAELYRAAACGSEPGNYGEQGCNGTEGP